MVTAPDTTKRGPTKSKWKMGLARAKYIRADQLEMDLTKFCDAIARKIRASDLDPRLKAEIGEDLSAYLGRLHLPVTGPNGQGKGRQQQRRKAKNRS
jgi:hypothetical protein